MSMADVKWWTRRDNATVNRMTILMFGFSILTCRQRRLMQWPQTKPRPWESCLRLPWPALSHILGSPTTIEIKVSAVFFVNRVSRSLAENHLKGNTRYSLLNKPNHEGTIKNENVRRCGSIGHYDHIATFRVFIILLFAFSSSYCSLCIFRVFFIILFACFASSPSYC